MNKSSGRLLADGRLPALIDSGQVQVYIAKYNYDPFQFSPNENPEAELPLNSGDYVFINGEMDEDGFFEGELIDGKKGLVPSNFVEKVPDVDLIDFSSIFVASGHHSDDNVLSNLAVQQDLDFNSSDESEQMSAILRLPDDKPLVLPNPDSVGDLGDIEEVEEDSSSLHLSLTDYSDYLSGDKQTESFFPRKLNLDRQLTNSLLISWLAPEIPRNTDIVSYQIFVDGEFKTMIKGNERTKALLENVDSKKIHRVTVVCVTTRSRSAHQQCTLLVGKDAVPTPTDLKVSHITANGALLSWWPGSTNYQHVISVNDQEMRVVNPGVYEYLLTGLAPATSHRVTIRAKSLLANFEEERNKDRKELLTSRIEFKTLAGGLPDPPLDVQVEVGPQEGTILLTWLPVTINRSGISPSGVIKGYSVYADDKLIKNVIGPINDHVLLNSANFSGFIPQRLTVRTLGDHNEESVDSQGVILPPSLLKEMAATTAKNIAYEAVAARKHDTYEDKQEDCTNDTDEEIEAAFRACVDMEAAVMTKKDAHNHTHYGQGLDYNSSSELSDIAEVDEEPEGEIEAPQPTGVIILYLHNYHDSPTLFFYDSLSFFSDILFLPLSLSLFTSSFSFFSSSLSLSLSVFSWSFVYIFSLTFPSNSSLSHPLLLSLSYSLAVCSSLFLSLPFFFSHFWSFSFPFLFILFPSSSLSFIVFLFLIIPFFFIVSTLPLSLFLFSLFFAQSHHSLSFVRYFRHFLSLSPSPSVYCHCSLLLSCHCSLQFCYHQCLSLFHCSPTTFTHCSLFPSLFSLLPLPFYFHFSVSLFTFTPLSLFTFASLSPFLLSLPSLPFYFHFPLSLFTFTALPPSLSPLPPFLFLLSLLSTFSFHYHHSLYFIVPLLYHYTLSPVFCHQSSILPSSSSFLSSLSSTPNFSYSSSLHSVLFFSLSFLDFHLDTPLSILYLFFLSRSSLPLLSFLSPPSLLGFFK
ncbi:RIMBP2 [Acanthosepion pharaonis]|uniref:RIMBP2 n=1 Tax=Acanthosepion pharaonis TaxID=158019 RepID=A0A812E2X3_ACAPH|nr:RIMBP2 [Sepia pharaonis]